MMPSFPVIDVVAGALLNAQNHILVSLRPQHVPQGGLWEFPGGKKDPGESSLEALARELQEELGIKIIRTRPMMHVQHRYPDKDVHLEVYWVDEFLGTPSGCEGQKIQWVAPSVLSSLEFPSANWPVITHIQQAVKKCML